MKKIGGLSILMLIMALLMFGCSGAGGGSTNNPASASGGGGTASGGGDNPAGSGGNSSSVGYLVINFDASGQAHARAAGSTIPIAQTSNHVRIIVSKQATDEEGNTTYSFKDVKDISVPGQLSETLPVGNGYSVDVVAYNNDGVANGTTKNLMTHYGRASFNINPGVATDVTLTLTKINTIISAPSLVVSDSTYEVSTSIQLPIRRDKNNLISASSKITTVPTGYDSTKESFQMTAPTLATLATATTWFQGAFFIDDAFLLTGSGEAFSDFIYVYPNPNWGDPDVKTLATGDGSATINISF